MKKFLPIVSLMAAMMLVGCGEQGKSSVTPGSSKQPASSSVAPASSSQAPASSSKAPASSSQAPASSSKTPASSSQAPASSSQAPTSSSQVPTTAYAPVAIDIVTEQQKIYVKVTGTISGFAKAEDAKFAFGLVSREATGGDSTAGNWILGSETPADADYKFVPTITGGNFEIKLEITNVQFAGDIYNIMTGPKGHYAAISLSNTQGSTAVGSGDAKIGGYRIYLRSDLGAIASDKLPPVTLNESYVKLEEGKVYHYIGGDVSMTETDFLALDPYLMYETTVGGWKQNRMDDKDPKPVSLVYNAGKGYVKCDVTDLAEDRYNTKVNFTEKKAVDTQMEVVIDTSANPVKLNGKAYYVYADKSHSGDKSYIYGNLGLVIEHYHTIVNNGDKSGQVQNIKCDNCNNVNGFELHTDAMTSGQVPTLSNNNTRLGKGTEKADIWDITGVAAGEYSIQLFCAGKDAGTLDSHWDGRIDVAAGSPANNHGGDKAGYRYTFKAGDEDYVEPTTTKTMRETGMTMANTGEYGLTEVIGTIMIKDGAGTFEIKNMDNGYACFIEGIRLLKVGNYKAPAAKLTFDAQGKARLEAENYTSTSNGASLDKVANAECSGGYYLGGFNSYGEEALYDFQLLETVNAKIVLKMSCHQDNNSYGAVEFYVDGTKLDNANYGSVDGSATADAPVFTEVEIPAREIAAGRHEIKIRTPWGAQTNFDYFEFVKVA